MEKDKIKSIIAIAIGEASMCWSEIPKGVFNSDHAVKICDRLFTNLNYEFLGKCEEAKQNKEFVGQQQPTGANRH